MVSRAGLRKRRYEMRMMVLVDGLWVTYDGVA